MIDRRALLKDLQGQLRALEKDLIEQIGGSGEHYDKLHSEYERAFKLKRTASTWTAWRDERATQTAVAWVLGTVFVRFCEDNGLFDAACYLTGPEKDRAVLAEESQDDYFRRHPERTDRHWLLTAFEHIGRTQAGKLLFDPEHNPAYRIPISHDAAKALIAFWRKRDPAGTLVHDFTDPEWDTRFLGDLYQELSESARKTYALLQTPEFVEEFILDLTLTPAINEFGHETIKTIDPTCGSGHFLLGIFRRLMTEWKEQYPERDRHEMVRAALESVHGVDINPFAVAIARFRLLLAAMREARFTTFAQIRQRAFPIQIAIGDSLIKNRQGTLFDDVDELARFRYVTEDIDNYPGLLSEGRYHVVVGNPPYITPKDKELNELYRSLYKDVCSGKYALSVPFAKRFFELAKPAESDGRGSGHVGQITANSFMKREFGRKLIKEYFAEKIDLTYVIDTSGAYIPGHGTPTVILVGRRTPRSMRADTIRTVMSIRGEPEEPADPENGKVWQAIKAQYNQAGSESQWISVANTLRTALSSFPWSLSGGGATSLSSQINKNSKVTLSSAIDGGIGFHTITGDDEIFTGNTRRPPQWNTQPLPETRRFITGDGVRDWINSSNLILWPYSHTKPNKELQSTRLFWPWRTNLRNGLAFGKTREERGMMWHEYTMLSWTRAQAERLISFACVSTHNQFILHTGTAVFNRHAPVIKLPEGATEDDHLRLLGVLNSSTACFWLKQVSQKKGGANNSGGGQSDQPWSWSYEFTGTKLQEFPLPKAYPLELARELDAAAQRLTAVSPAAVASEGTPTREKFSAAQSEWHSVRGRMIALQEELDWQVYHQYALLPEELTAPAESVPELQLGERAFEIVLARKMAAGTAETQWFARHGSTPITELPDHWSAEYRAVVEKRIKVIEQNRYLALIERPECKRRWSTEGWDRMLDRALRDWLLDRCEARDLWYAPDENGITQPRPLSIAQLADELRRDADFLAVADLYDPGKDLSALLTELIEPEHVPYLAALRYTETGLTKRAGWEHVWDLQRQEDAAPDEPTKQGIRKQIPLPDKYKPADFRKNSFWSHRGKLDVPKERFVSYPLAGRDNDPSLLIGWAGWDHREQAQALAVLVVQRDEEAGWSAEKLTPLLAGLREVMPWVRQWHGAIDPEIGDSPAIIYDGFLTERLGTHGLTDGDLAAWRPPAPTRGRRRA